MKVDRLFDHYDPVTFPADAQGARQCRLRVLGEAANEPFIAVASGASSRSRLALRTGVAVALPRSPTHVAYAGNDLQLLSQGRFILGLRSQVRVTSSVDSAQGGPIPSRRRCCYSPH